MSVTNFLKETSALTEDEKQLVPFLIEGFKTKSKNNPIKSPEVVRKLNEHLKAKGSQLKISGVRLRKLCNYIRSNGLMPLIATSNGYYFSDDKEEIKSQIKSLRDRAKAINHSADGLEKFLH